MYAESKKGRFYMMRCATKNDIPVLKKIWKDIFADSDSFIDWFFEYRFNPQLSFCTEMNGKIVCVLHCYPIDLKIGDKNITAVMVSGVATLPEYRKQKLMHNLFHYALDQLDRHDYPLCFYFPANPAFYTGLGHVRLTDFITLNNAQFSAKKEETTFVDISQNIQNLEKCYNNFSEKYSCIVLRKNNFASKMKEYIAENLICEASVKNEEITAYAIYNKKTSALEIAEAVGDSYDIINILSGYTFSGKLPPDLCIDTLNISADFSEGAMGGIVNVAKLLSALNLNCPLILKVTDDFFPNNNGTYDFSGQTSEKTPDLTISSGELLQTLTGYKVHPSLSDYFKEYPCYTTDLY